jgi:hypothetical protein
MGAERSGKSFTNRVDGKQAPVWRGDCAAAAAAVRGIRGHDYAVKEFSGPLTIDDITLATTSTTRLRPQANVYASCDEEPGSGLQSRLASRSRLHRCSSNWRTIRRTAYTRRNRE